MTFDRVKFIYNIYTICRSKNLPIRKLEEACNLTAGRLSRYRSADNTVMSVETAYKIACFLGVSLDYLINEDSDAFSETENYIYGFVNMLNQNTRDGKQDWGIITSDTFYYESTNRDDVPHLLCRVDPNYSFEIEEFYNSCRFKSQFSEDSKVVDDCFYTALDSEGKCILHLLKISYNKLPPAVIEKARERDFIGYEMYIQEDKNVINSVCSSIFLRDSLASKIEDLYNLVNNSNSKMYLGPRVKNIIKDYLKGEN